MAGVRLDKVRKVYENGHVAVGGASFEAADGELLALVGPSGCGKSTLLRMIAGLEGITSGDLQIGNRRVNDLSPRDRDVAMVFQSYALYPHMNVYDNLAFGLRLRGADQASLDSQVRAAAAMLGLETVLDHRPRQLSGGQRQRVALGRALVRNPKVFLLDEPLSNLDAKLRLGMRTEIAKLHRRLGATMIYVTHDQVEAMTLGQRIVVLNAGEIQQIDTPMRLYNEPANLFVAGFLGSPAMNFFRGRVVADPIPRLACAAGFLPLPAEVSRHSALSEIVVGIRPEDLRIVRTGADVSQSLCIQAKVESVEPVGNEVFLTVTFAGGERVCRAPPAELPKPGQQIQLQYASERLRCFDARTGLRLN
jgi:multiple sugar transport system ATP-binding protein